MKKKSVLSVITIFLFLLLCLFFYYLSLPNYEIHSSISNSHSHGTVRETELEVSVFRFWKYDELIEEIEEEFIEVNGKPTTLEINLYHWTTRGKDKPFLSKTFEY